MSERIESNVRNFLENQDQDSAMSGNINVNEIKKCKEAIFAGYMQLEVLKAEMLQLATNIRISIGNFDHFHRSFHEFSTTAAAAQHVTLLNIGSNSEALHQNENFTFLSDITQRILDESINILQFKSDLEERLARTEPSVLFIKEQVQEYKRLYEKLHTFSNRGSSFNGVNIEEVGVKVEETIQFLQDVYSCSISWHTEFNFPRFLSTILEVFPFAQPQVARPLLLDPGSFQSKLENLANDLLKLQWPFYQIFTLVMEYQPPMVLMKKTRRHISLRVFNLNNIFTANFNLNAYLVNEDTVQAIRSRMEIPNKIESAGLIALTDISRKRRNLSGEDVISLAVCSAVAKLQENYSSSKRCRLLEKELTITTRDGRVNKAGREGRQSKAPNSANNVTDYKVALLFVCELFFGNETRKVWEFSLPMVVAAHGSQNEKAWITIAWDDALSTAKRLGFEVEATAKWSQIVEILKGTFEVLVGCELKQPHVEYLRKKATKQLGSKYPHAITREDLSEDREGKISLWSWFYKAVSVVKKSGHFHESWEKGYIEGFIDYEDTREILLRSTVKPGTFIMRFSDAEPGSLTIVFKSFDHKIYKLEPVEMYKTKAIKEYAKELVSKLNVRENKLRREVFVRVFPDICKREAFKKFYDEIPEQNKHVGYEIISNMIQTSNNANGNIPKDIDASGSGAAANPPVDENVSLPSCRMSEDNVGQPQLSPHFPDATSDPGMELVSDSQMDIDFNIEEILDFSWQ